MFRFARHKSARLTIAIALAAYAAIASRASIAVEVPIAGYLPLAGLSLTDEYKDDSAAEFSIFADDEPSLVGNQLGTGSVPHYDLALLDTGASVSIITQAADTKFDLQAPFSRNPDGLRGTNLQTIGGATGFLDTIISDPLGTFVTGTANRLEGPDGNMFFDRNSFIGQSSVSILTIPPESDLPNVVGIPLLSRYATFIRNDQPQIFEFDGQTVRTPNIEFHTRGTGNQLGISRRAPIMLNSPSGFSQQPIYIFDFSAILSGDPLYENPQTPTVLAEPGALFINATVNNGGEELNTNFAFDTGADVSVLSEFQASQLGFDVVLDKPEFTVAIVGSGGVNLDVPGFFVDEFRIEAIGGDIIAQNVPVIVFDVTNPADPGNIVDGIIGTNLFARRNLVIDPNPSLGGGGAAPSLYISDPITMDVAWSSVDATNTWETAANWDAGSAPDILDVVNLQHVAGDSQEILLTSAATVWEVNVSGSASQTISLQVAQDAELTTYSGISLGPNGHMQLSGGTVDTQFIDIRGGRLVGEGSVFTGSGPIPGQVENNIGFVAPGVEIGTLNIEGRYSNGAQGTLEIELGGTTPGSQFDQLIVDGDVALAGTLDVSLVSLDGTGAPFEPSPDDSFEIIAATGSRSGTFDLLQLPSGIDWDVVYTPNGVLLNVISALIDGDYNGDGAVNAADYTVWRESLGTANMAADGNGDGTVDADDYAVWKNRFGGTTGTGSVSIRTSTVPEPTSLLIAALGLACFIAAAQPRRLRFDRSDAR